LLGEKFVISSSKRGYDRHENEKLKNNTNEPNQTTKYNHVENVLFYLFKLFPFSFERRRYTNTKLIPLQFYNNYYYY